MAGAALELFSVYFVEIAVVRNVPNFGLVTVSVSCIKLSHSSGETLW